MVVAGCRGLGLPSGDQSRLGNRNGRLHLDPDTGATLLLTTGAAGLNQCYTSYTIMLNSRCPILESSLVRLFCESECFNGIYFSTVTHHGRNARFLFLCINLTRRVFHNQCVMCYLIKTLLTREKGKGSKFRCWRK